MSSQELLSLLYEFDALDITLQKEKDQDKISRITKEQSEILERYMQICKRNSILQA
jgi:uncharacterized membrane protein (DUF106 family)